jgi:hypothetical protein
MTGGGYERPSHELIFGAGIPREYDSNVVTEQVINSCNEVFERPALGAVSKWKFRPGRLVNSRVQQVITFNLEDR